MASWWRRFADSTTEGSGSWKRRAATARDATMGFGGWARRIAGGEAETSGPWSRQIAGSAGGTGSWMRRAVESWSPEFLGARYIADWDSNDATETEWPDKRNGWTPAGSAGIDDGFVTFSGSQAFTLAPSPLPSGSAECEVWVKFESTRDPSVAGSDHLISWGNTGTAGTGRAARVGTGVGVRRIQTFAGNGSANTQAVGSVISVAGVVVSRHVFRADTLFSEVDGQVDGSIIGTLAGTATTRMRIGANASTTAAGFAQARIQRIIVTGILTDNEAERMRQYLGVTPPDYPTEDYNPDDWISVPTGNDVTVNGQPYNNHSAGKSYSLGIRVGLPSLERYEIRQGDEWSGDAGRVPSFDRSELDSRTIETPDENGDIFFHAQILPYGVERGNRVSIIQLFNDQVYLQVNSAPSGLVVTTFQGAGGTLTATDRFIGEPLRSGEPEAIVVRIRPDPASGQVQVWRNGTIMCNLSGLNIGQSGAIPRWKRGLYRATNPAVISVQVANFKRGAEAFDCIANPLPFPEFW